MFFYIFTFSLLCLFFGIFLLKLLGILVSFFNMLFSVVYWYFFSFLNLFKLLGSFLSFFLIAFEMILSIFGLVFFIFYPFSELWLVIWRVGSIWAFFLFINYCDWIIDFEILVFNRLLMLILLGFLSLLDRTLSLLFKFGKRRNWLVWISILICWPLILLHVYWLRFLLGKRFLFLNILGDWWLFLLIWDLRVEFNLALITSFCATLTIWIAFS